MSDLNVEELGFKPISSAPSQFSFYGVGTRLYGRKAVENFSDIYTKNLYFTVLFVPLMALGKYLVQQHEGNEYILGKGKLSGFSKGWNFLLISFFAVFVSFVFYQKHVSSPEYIAQELYQDALESIDEKDYDTATKNLKLVYNGQTSSKSLAESKLRELLKPDNLKRNSPIEVFAIIKNIASLKALLPDALETYRLYFSKFENSSPAVASEFADLIVKYSTDESEIQTYNNKNYRLLKIIYNKEPGNFTIATRYALLEERLNNCLECVNILEAHREQLAETEAARILGQAYARSNQVEKAYELLLPYVQSKIDVYHRAEEAYNEAVNKVWDDSMAYLNDGKASQSFYDQYDASTKEQQGQMVDEFYAKRRDASSIVSQTRDAYIESTTVVPVVLDLGIVLLNRALALADPSQREDSLTQAEQTFLSVQNYAGDSDEYQLHLAQVYYWLGKEEEGDKLFTALLDKYQRSHQVLSSLSNTLRELGAFSKSKEYALEAYQNATEAKDKSAYAQNLALLANKLDEKIEWLEKADQTNPYVKGDLLTAKGRKAASENNKAQALKLFQQSIQVYEKISEDATQLNNIALIYMSKYRVGHQQQDFVKALEMLDRAVALVPEDSIVLNNAAYQHLEKAYTDVLSPHIDFEALDASPSLNYFSYLYSTQVEKDQFIGQLAQHSSFKKALGYLQKAMLLAPKSADILDSLYALYIFLDRQEDIKQLATRFEKIEVDLQHQIDDISDFRNGVDREKYRKDYDDYLSDLKTIATSPKNADHELNKTILTSTLIATQLRAVDYGKPLDSRDLLRRAKINFKLNNASSVRGDLKDALIHSLLVSASKKLPSFAKFYDQFKVVLGETSLLAIALGSDKEFNHFVKTSSEGKELESLIIQGYENFPKSPNIVNWKILDSLGSSDASRLKHAFFASPIQKQKDSLLFKRTASQEYVVMYKLILHEMNGDKDAAKKLNDEAISNGVLLPDFGY